jgi:subtilisin family serine protease
MPGSIPVINGTWRGREASFRADRIIISVGDNISEIAIEGTIDQAISLIQQGATKLSFRPGRRWATIGLSPGTNVIQAIGRIEAHPDLEYAEPDFILYGRTTPNDHDYATGVQKWPGLINLPHAWEFTQGSGRVLLAVLDSGIPIQGEKFDNVDLCDPAHPKVRDEDGRYIARHKDSTNRVVNHDYVDDDDMPDDGNGHGTWVTGILAAMSNNDKGIVGTNWNSRVYIARVLDDGKQFPMGSVSIVKEAMDDLILYAISKAFDHIVVNMSFGSADPSFMQPDARAYAADVMDSLDEMCRDAEEFTIRGKLKGRCILCCAPQFNGTGSTAKADYPARYATKYDHVISVGSTYDDDTIALPGPTNEPADPKEVTILAPGNSAPQTTLLTSTSGAPTSDGTSLASPMVAGVASLMWSRNLNLTPKQIKQCIWSTGHDIPGRSRPYRRVDAGRAVEASNGSITLLTPLIEYADVPTGLVKTQLVKMRVVGCVGLTFTVKSTAMDAAFSVGTSTMSYNTPGRLRRLSGISVNYTAGVAGSTAVGSITIECVETGETWTADLKANAVKPFA